jgi:hypothetical protein
MEALICWHAGHLIHRGRVTGRVLARAFEPSQSCKTTLRSDALIFMGCSAVYSMKPSRLNLFRKKLTRERVVPIMSARLACEIVGTIRMGVSIPRQQQQRSRQPLLAGVEQLIDQVFFDPDIARQHVRDESVGHGVLLVQQPHHRGFGDEEDFTWHDGRRTAHSDRLAGQAPLAE